MTNSLATRIAAALGFLAVPLGALGAHGLNPTLTANGMVEVWKTAVFYHLIHAVMLFVLAQRQPLRRGPWMCFFGGILVFSGSLYALALSNVKWLGATTPIGGVLFLVGWACLAICRGKAAE